MKSKKFLLSAVAFMLLNATFYLFIVIFNNKVSFNKFNYYYNAHHYIQDSRITENTFNIFNALGQFDAQWYLKIADKGYSKNPREANLNNKENLSGLDYAFFPVYPLLMSIVNIPINNIEISAFILSNILLLLNFTSLYLVIKRLMSEKIALKTISLLFTFPFSIFYRSYFAEGLFLLALIWFTYFLLKSKYLLSGLILGLLNFVKGNAILLNLVFLYYVYDFIKDFEFLKKTKNLMLIGIFVLTPFLIWFLYLSIQAGTPMYFINVRSEWVSNEFPLIRFAQNISSIISFPSLSFHLFHSSKIDALIVIVVFILLILSKNKLPRKLWLISGMLWLTPLMFSDLMSFSRHQIVSFPIFIYLASVLNGTSYKIVLLLFFAGLFITSLFFINWYWVG